MAREIIFLKQEPARVKKTVLFIALSVVVFVLASIVLLDRTPWSVWSFVPLFPSIAFCLFYLLTGNSLFGMRLPYLRVDDDHIGWKSTLFGTSHTVAWKNVQRVEVKLFSIYLEEKSGAQHLVDLNSLLDENLKTTKELITTIGKANNLL